MKGKLDVDGRMLEREEKKNRKEERAEGEGISRKRGKEGRKRKKGKEKRGYKKKR